MSGMNFIKPAAGKWIAMSQIRHMMMAIPDRNSIYIILSS
jgi:hypothetical protein